MLLWRLSALVLCSSMLGCGGENCPPDAEPDCVDNRDCEEVYRDMYDQLRELYYGCGLTIDMPEEPDPIPDPCDETLKAQLQCVEDCEYDVSCDALKGYDLNAWAAWESCHQSCQ